MPDSIYYSPDVLGKDTFLKLLSTQLKYQDPFQPMENTEFLAQLAQFSALEQLLNINGNLQANFLITQSMNNSIAATLVGKTAKVYGNTVWVNKEGDSYINYKLNSFAKATIKIYDENHNLVRTINTEWQDAGENEILWDGKNNNGMRVPEGKYNFEVEATDATGNKVNVTTFIKGKITGVRFTDNGAVFIINGLEINFSDIFEFGE